MSFDLSCFSSLFSIFTSSCDLNSRNIPSTPLWNSLVWKRPFFELLLLFHTYVQQHSWTHTKFTHMPLFSQSIQAVLKCTAPKPASSRTMTSSPSHSRLISTPLQRSTGLRRTFWRFKDSAAGALEAYQTVSQTHQLRLEDNFTTYATILWNIDLFSSKLTEYSLKDAIIYTYTVGLQTKTFWIAFPWWGVVGKGPSCLLHWLTMRALLLLKATLDFKDPTGNNNLIDK